MDIIKFAIVAILLTLTGCAGMQPAKNQESSIEMIEDAQGFSKDAIYISTKVWIAENFKSSKAVIEDADKDAARIIGNGTVKFPCYGTWDCLAQKDKILGFTMRIDAKDNKFKVTYSNLKMITLPTSGSLVGIVYTPGQHYEEQPLILQGDVDAAKAGLVALTQEIKKSIMAEPGKANW